MPPLRPLRTRKCACLLFRISAFLTVHIAESKSRLKNQHRRMPCLHVRRTEFPTHSKPRPTDDPFVIQIPAQRAARPFQSPVPHFLALYDTNPLRSSHRPRPRPRPRPRFAPRLYPTPPRMSFHSAVPSFGAGDATTATGSSSFFSYPRPRLLFPRSKIPASTSSIQSYCCRPSAPESARGRGRAQALEIARVLHVRHARPPRSSIAFFASALVLEGDSENFLDRRAAPNGIGATSRCGEEAQAPGAALTGTGPAWPFTSAGCAPLRRILALETTNAPIRIRSYCTTDRLRPVALKDAILEVPFTQTKDNARCAMLDDSITPWLSRSRTSFIASAAVSFRAPSLSNSPFAARAHQGVESRAAAVAAIALL
ncbi:hypothetical protein MSAN_02507900 [Mycena sanguinolenta]|uniref:Uncharacterized protein n=1 Tax=Mycena sanguinolenta TaxID=230812 RepID=A0A8H6TW55_9AGAR|nr:hypothetical protein MSAN_02507900 [Mycena sanguinolenta]